MIAPATALVLVFLYSVVISLQSHIYLPMLLPPFALAFFHRHALKSILKKLLFLNVLIVLIVVTLVWQHQYAMACLIFVRSNLILLFGLLLFYDKDEFSIAIGVHQLRLPSKLSSMLFFTAKSIFLLKHEFEVFKKTLHIRGFQAKTNLFSYKTLAGLIGILVIKAIERASYLQKAMLLRHFSGTIYTLKSHPLFGMMDFFWILFTCLSLLWRQGVLL